MCLTGIMNVEPRYDVDATAMNRAMVLHNLVLFGTVNAGRRHWEQAVDLQPCRAALAVATSTNEAGPFEHLEMLGDGRLRQGGCLGEFDHTGFAGCEALEDRPAGWIGERRESEAQGVTARHYQ